MEPTQSKEWTWFRVPARLSDVLPTIGRAVSVYLVLARHADIDGQCFPSHATIATAAGISERSVRDHLAILNCAGLVTWKRRRRESDLYTLPDLAALKNGNTLPVKDPKNGNGLPFKSDKNGKGLPVKRPTAAKNGKNSQQERQKCVVKNGENSPPKYTSEGEPVKEKIDHLDVVLKNAREASGEPSEWERADARLQGWIKRGQLPRLDAENGFSAEERFRTWVKIAYLTGSRLPEALVADAVQGLLQKDKKGRIPSGKRWGYLFATIRNNAAEKYGLDLERELAVVSIPAPETTEA